MTGVVHFELVFCDVTSSLWDTSRYSSLNAARAASSTLKPVKPVSSLLGSSVGATDGTAAAEEEQREPRHSDRWKSTSGRKRTAPGHDLQHKTHTHTHQSPLAEERDTAEGPSLEGGRVQDTSLSPSGYLWLPVVGGAR